MAMTKGTCRLCLQEKQLIGASHIIPDFMYKILYDENHKLRYVDPQKYFVEGESVEFVPSGPYSKGILCQNCDNVVLQRLEDYACKILYAQKLSPKLKPTVTNYIGIDGQEYSICANIDYKKFKLFVLSLLWRASVSDHPMFNTINLGEKEETIRDMIYSGNPKTNSDYPIFLFSWLNDKNAHKDYIAQPKDQDVRYIFPIRGIIYNIYKDIHSIPLALRDYILKEDGSMAIFHLPVGEYLNFIAKYHNGGVGER